MTDFVPIKPKNIAELREICLCGVPFLLPSGDFQPANLCGQTLYINSYAEALCFLGMVTERPEGSDRWGMCDRTYSFQHRLFIGDRFGRIRIRFGDTTQVNIPLLFGVNVWPYELYFGVGKDEKLVARGGAVEAGPYREPFESDKEAKALLDESLLLTEAGNSKHTKYIFTLSNINSVVDSIEIIDEQNKSAGFNISAVTAISKQASLGKLRLTDIRYFYEQKHITPMRRLSQRLYQHKSLIPDFVELVLPAKGEPNIYFEGNAAAQIFANVMTVNFKDMKYGKLDADGEMHTSTFNAPSFGRYIGFGTYKEQDGAYFEHIWSRDAGRMMIELIKLGERERVLAAAEKAFTYLYDNNVKYDLPNWKRVINGSKVGNPGQLKSWSSRENDGHGLLMLFIYQLFINGIADENWMKENLIHLDKAANWFCWQMDNPEKSGFNGTLYSDSEPAGGGGRDFYSNYIACQSLFAFSHIARLLGYVDLEAKWTEYAKRLEEGINKEFYITDSERGTLFTDTYTGFDSWVLGFKVFAPLMISADFKGYDIGRQDSELYDICQNTYKELLADYKSNAYGRIMGYCQAFALQAAILLDRYDDLTNLAESTALMCFHRDHNYIVPEGVIMHPSGEYWYRNGDLGNSVQQAEVVKCARLLLGLDDLNISRGLAVIPRLPDSFSKMGACDFPVTVFYNGKSQNVAVNYSYERINSGYVFELIAAEPIRLESIRVGSFPESCCDFKINGGNSFEAGDVKTLNGRKFLYIKYNGEAAQTFRLSVCEAGKTNE